MGANYVYGYKTGATTPIMYGDRSTGFTGKYAIGVFTEGKTSTAALVESPELAVIIGRALAEHFGSAFNGNAFGWPDDGISEERTH